MTWQLRDEESRVKKPAASAVHPANVIELGVIELGAGHDQHPWSDLPGREIPPEDWQRFRDYVAEIFAAFGMELDTPGTRETPERFLSALRDATAGYEGDPKLLTAFPSESHGSEGAATSQIVEGPISFQSLCEHHALPFHGHAHIGYVAGDRIIGISKLTRLVRMFARRFTVQERLGEQIADALVELVAPQGVAVHLDASHLCTQMRGVEESSRTVTTFWRGAFATEPDLRREFLDEVRSHARH
jgi:GTP cyclohydrolase I